MSAMSPAPLDNTMTMPTATHLSITGCKNALLELIVYHKGKAAIDLHGNQRVNVVSSNST